MPIVYVFRVCRRKNVLWSQRKYVNNLLVNKFNEKMLANAIKM